MAYAVPSFRNWQYLSMRVAAKMAYTSMRIILVYECNANVVYFDGVQLFTASGQRISKTVNGTTYNYHYLGDQLVEMAWGANRMHFTYDAVGPLSVNFNGTEYFYLKNAQGDVTGLVDSTGTKVVAYTYGPWGEAWGASGTLASTLGAFNPLRYRGYVYDTETGLYYLNSRYYNPTWGRFINADTTDVLGASLDKANWDKNLFAYCDNNPIIRVDHGGQIWMLIGAAVGAFVSGAVSAISQYATTGSINWKTVGINAAAGAVSGALATTGIGLVASIGANAGLGGAAYVSDQIVNGDEITLDGLVTNTIAGGVGGAIGGSGANAKGLSAAWKSASNSITRELRRANIKYAAKRISAYTAEKTAIKIAAKIAVGRIGFGTIASAITAWKLKKH